MIISILGMAGMNRDKSDKTTAFYDCGILNKQSGDYHNATDMLLKNYNDTFYFLGTQKAIAFQKQLLSYDKDKVKFLEIKDNSLDDIFEKVYELISKSKDQVILDITHGFRHQPISAIFSATLHRFLNASNLQIIFAKQIEEHTKYAYILLNDYINITQLSLLLTGFIRTLNFVDTIEIEGFETIAFANFSKALLSNDFLTLERAYKNLLATIQRAKTDAKFDHLKELFENIEDTLSIFDGFDKFSLHKKYLIIANLMYEKNYILLSLTYLFEAIRFYCSDAFEKNNITCQRSKHRNIDYNINQEVITFITQKSISKYQPNCYDEKYHYLHSNNIKIFTRIANEYKILRELRNNLTHINTKAHTPDIKIKLKKQLEVVDDFIKQDILKKIDNRQIKREKVVKNFFKKD